MLHIEELHDLNFSASVMQFYNLLSDVVSNSGHIASNDWTSVNNELEGIMKETVI
jgi:hypothetical protein